MDIITLTGTITAADTATAITNQGSITTPSRQVPAGATKIDRLMLASAADVAAAGSAVIFLRLTGKGIKNGDQTIVFAASGGQAAQAGSDQAPQTMNVLILEDCDIEVSEGDTVTVQAEMAGSDMGTARVVVGLGFA